MKFPEADCVIGHSFGTSIDESSVNATPALHDPIMIAQAPSNLDTFSCFMGSIQHMRLAAAKDARPAINPENELSALNMVLQYKKLDPEITTRTVMSQDRKATKITLHLL